MQFPVYYDDQFIIVGNMTNEEETKYAIQEVVKAVKVYAKGGQYVSLINPTQRLMKSFDENKIKYQTVQSLQPKYAHSCAWYMPVLHQLQGRPWTPLNIEGFFK